MNKGKLIVALDVDTFEQGCKLVETLGDAVEIYKVGSQLFTACGPVIIRHLIAQGKNVFLDLKFHDIPNTVANAVRAAALLGVPVYELAEKQNKNTDGAIFMMTLHACGGEEMMAAAVAAADDAANSAGVLRPLLVGVTILTSTQNGDNISDLVKERATSARNAGLDGIVASSQESSLVRRECGEDFVIVTPGIRPQGADHGDQKRVTTPAEAIANGSNYLVVGRPIVQADDPRSAAELINQEILAC